MSASLVAILVLCAGLAAVNGANDVSKGVATLAGAGVTRYGTAIAWGVATTLAGSALSLILATRISTVFTKGIVAVSPSPAFSLAVLAGAVAWVAVATAIRLPVSTTHAIVGALLGAGLLLEPTSVHWASLSVKVVIPLLASVAGSYALSALLTKVSRRAPQCLCIEVRDGSASTLTVPSGQTTVAAMALPVHPVPNVGVVATRSETCAIHGDTARRIGINVNGAHWLTSGGTSFARGLNDTPKIWAVGAFALVPGHLDATELLALVAIAMAVGGSVAGIRIARRLGERVVSMTHREGFSANLTTALLVGAGANLGLPMSTTHVATGAIAGTAGRDLRRLDTHTLRDFALAWTMTPAVAAAVAAGVYALIR
jgi:PiT family inorganic phosphate transporter